MADNFKIYNIKLKTTKISKTIQIYMEKKKKDNKKKDLLYAFAMLLKESSTSQDLEKYEKS